MGILIIVPLRTVRGQTYICSTWKHDLWWRCVGTTLVTSCFHSSTPRRRLISFISVVSWRSLEKFAAATGELKWIIWHIMLLRKYREKLIRVYMSRYNYIAGSHVQNFSDASSQMFWHFDLADNSGTSMQKLEQREEMGSYIAFQVLLPNLTCHSLYPLEKSIIQSLPKMIC